MTSSLHYLQAILDASKLFVKVRAIMKIKPNSGLALYDHDNLFKF